MTDAPHSDQDAPASLADELRDRLQWLCVLFGQPSELLLGLPIPEWRRLRAWVRSVEALAARLVRALAATIESPPSTPPPPAPAFRVARAAPDTGCPDSEHWPGVRFRFRDGARDGAPAVAPPRAAATGLAGRRRSEEAWSGVRSARPLALRLEAVIRVASRAHAYARRLARRRARPAPAAPRRIEPAAPRVARVTALGPPLRPPVIGTG